MDKLEELVAAARGATEEARAAAQASFSTSGRTSVRHHMRAVKALNRARKALSAASSLVGEEGSSKIATLLVEFRRALATEVLTATITLDPGALRIALSRAERANKVLGALVDAPSASAV